MYQPIAGVRESLAAHQALNDESKPEFAPIVSLRRAESAYVNSEGPFRDQNSSPARQPLSTMDSYLETYVHPVCSHLGFSSRSPSQTLIQRAIHQHSPRMLAVVHSSGFTAIVGTAICLNAIVVAIEGHEQLQDSLYNYDKRMLGLPEIDGGRQYLHYANIIFCIFFTIELTIRILGEGALFLCGAEWRWNLFDSFLMLASLLSFIGISDSNLSFGRLLRLVRLSRALRTVKMLNYFRETRIILTAVLNSVVPLIWSLVFVILVLFLFAVFMMSVFTDFLDGQNPPENLINITIVKTYFDSFWMTMLSLFMCISGGQDWYEITGLVIRYSPLYAIVIVAYISLMILGLLNIVNGVFVAAAADMSRMDRETATLDETAKRVQYIKSLQKIFTEFDEDGSGTLTWAEFHKHMENSEVQAYLAALEINVTKARALFKLLDVDGSEQVSLDEFVMGCLRLKGGAKTLDVGTLMYEMRALKHIILKEREAVSNNFEKLSTAMSASIESMSLEVRKKSREGRQSRRPAKNDSPEKGSSTSSLTL